MLLSRFNPLKVIFAILWSVLFGTALVGWWQSSLALADIPLFLEERLREFGLYRAALIYIFLYAVRPLIFFPATLLTLAAGLLFGPWLGILFTIVGENASANFAFRLARWFGRNVVAERETGLLKRWDRKLEENGLVAVLLMRLAMLPFDLVNFGCGLTAVRQRDFFIGTFIGILPALVAFVLLGGVAAAGVEHRLAILLLSLFFMITGLVLARWIKHRDRKSAPSP